MDFASRHRISRFGALLAVAPAALLSGCLFGGGGGEGVQHDPTAEGSAFVVEDTAAAWQQQAEQDPTQPYWPYQLGQAKHSEDSDAALAYYRQALAIDVSYVPALTSISELLYQRGSHEEALGLIEPVLATGTAPDALRLAAALHYEALEYYDDSDAIVASLENGGTSWEDLGSALTFLKLRGERPAAAAPMAAKALDADEDSAANHNNQGIAFLYAGDPIAARQSFLRALELKPGLPGALYNLALTEKFYFQDDDAAQEWFEQYSKVASVDPDGLAELLVEGNSSASEAR